MTKTKTYSFILAVESPVEITAEFIEMGLAAYMDDDNHYKDYGTTKITIEPLGQVNLIENEDI